MRNMLDQDVPRQVVQKIEAGLSERRLLDEIGKLSCDELAAVLVMWNRGRAAAQNPGQ